jgi:hypothetical protein
MTLAKVKKFFPKDLLIQRFYLGTKIGNIVKPGVQGTRFRTQDSHNQNVSHCGALPGVPCGGWGDI